MSLETEIQNLTAAVENLAFIMKQISAMQNTTAVENKNVYAPLRTDDEVKNPQVIKEEATRGAPEPMLTQSTPAVVAPPAIQMPPLPVFAAPPVAPPAPPVVQTKAPFTNAAELMKYLTESYTSMGAEKGAKIQEVMKALNVTAVTDVKPEQYDALFAGVEALK
jgi:hypothetical protein